MRVASLTVCLGLFVSSLFADVQRGMPKEFFGLRGKNAKEFFFSYLGKKIDLENKKILVERRFIKSLGKQKNFKEDSYQYKGLVTLQKKYKVHDLYDYKTFLKRIDIIPPSLALAQAATESGWGKSRFLKIANNIFGHWTYNPKMGIVPERRPEGKKHLIRVFQTLDASIAAYMRNLNRTGAYQEFRDRRLRMRESGELISGFILSETMHLYSGIGHNYVDILKQIIKKNNLTNLDKKFFNENIKQLNTKKEINEIHSTTKI